MTWPFLSDRWHGPYVLMTWSICVWWYGSFCLPDVMVLFAWWNGPLRWSFLCGKCHGSFCLMTWPINMIVFVWQMQWLFLSERWHCPFCLTYIIVILADDMALFVWEMPMSILCDEMALFVWQMTWPCLSGRWHGSLCLTDGMVPFVC